MTVTKTMKLAVTLLLTLGVVGAVNGLLRLGDQVGPSVRCWEVECIHQTLDKVPLSRLWQLLSSAAAMGKWCASILRGLPARSLPQSFQHSTMSDNTAAKTAEVNNLIRTLLIGRLNSLKTLALKEVLLRDIDSGSNNNNNNNHDDDDNTGVHKRPFDSISYNTDLGGFK